MVGLPIAAAVDALTGNPDGGLEVLKDLAPEVVEAGKQMLIDKQVLVGIADVSSVLYAESRVAHGQDWVRVCIADAHTHVILIEKNGETLFSAQTADTESEHYSLSGATALAFMTFRRRRHLPTSLLSWTPRKSTRACLRKESLATTACTSGRL